MLRAVFLDLLKKLKDKNLPNLDCWEGVPF